MSRREATAAHVQRCNEGARRGTGSTSTGFVRALVIRALVIRALVIRALVIRALVIRALVIRAVVIGLVVAFAAFGVNGTVWADLHIVTESSVTMPGMPQFPGMPGMDAMSGDDDVEQLFIKNNRILMPYADSEQFLIDCATGQFAIVAPAAAAYWQGTVAEMMAEMAELFAMMGMDDPGDDDLFGDMFGSNQGAGPGRVRTTRVGTENVAGYDTVHYRVEFEEDGTWKLFEEVWLAPALLQQVRSEVGDCIHTVAREVQMTMSRLMVGDEDEMMSIVASPEYTALFEQGYPVRQRSVISMFGMTLETASAVTSVSREPLDEAMFVIPADYRRISLLEAMMGGGM